MSVPSSPRSDGSVPLSPVLNEPRSSVDSRESGDSRIVPTVLFAEGLCPRAEETTTKSSAVGAASSAIDSQETMDDAIVPVTPFSVAHSFESTSKDDSQTLNGEASTGTRISAERLVPSIKV